MVGVLVSSDNEEYANPRPVVGILSLPIKGSTTEHYISAGYVKWLESAGARSIAIPYDADDELVEEILGQVNGLFFPGGSATLPAAAKTLWKRAVEKNESGEYFPVWGTCLGFQFMVMLAAEAGESILQTGFVSENTSMPLLFPTSDDAVYSTRSRLYSDTSLYKVFATQDVTMNNHHDGIEPDAFAADAGLTSTYRITSTNFDDTGRPFVSTMESLDRPYFAVQYHPEKNNFEYGVQPGTDTPFENINHSSNGILTSFYLAHFFVNEVRKNKSGKYTLVDRHPLVYTYEMRHSIKFEQYFVIPLSSAWKSETPVTMGTHVPLFSANTDHIAIHGSLG